MIYVMKVSDCGARKADCCDDELTTCPVVVMVQGACGHDDMMQDCNDLMIT